MPFSVQNWVRSRLKKLPRRGRACRKKSGAILALGMATAWGTNAMATDVHLHVRPSDTIYEPYALYYNLNGSYTAFFDLGASIPGGVTSSFQHELPWEPSEFRGYSVIGLHGPVGNRGLSLAFPDDKRIASGATWESFITEVYGAPDLFYPTPFVIDNWGDNFADIIQTSFPSYIETTFGERATITNFSVATNGGWALATVPEPCTSALLVTIGGILATPIRRRPG